MKNIFRIVAVAVLLSSTVTAFAQGYGRYEVRWGKIYYGNVELHGADARTIQDLGYGYAKDCCNVYWNGQILPYVDPTYFRLNDRYADRPPMKQEPGRRPGYDNYGYIITGNAVLFNGRVVLGARAASFKDLEWGYAADAYHVYYCGEVIQGANVRNFKVIKDGYAKNSYDVYYLGQKIHGAVSSSFKLLSDGYAKDLFSVYYCGEKIQQANVHTFKVLRGGYAQDFFHSYYLGKVLK